MSSSPIKLAIVGVGKIVRDQHLPSIASNPCFSLEATASRNASVDGVAAFKDIESMLDECALDAVALCMPPQYRFTAAKLALESGKHVLLEKPPGATVSEVERLHALATEHQVSLYTTWHSRYGAAVATAKAMLADLELQSVALSWKEDVRKWHPGQEWIWQAGGLGVFDPGVNGISILTECLLQQAFVSKADLSFPENRAAPIAARVIFKTCDGIEIDGDFDWRQQDGEAWNIDFTTDKGVLQIRDGGAALRFNGEEVSVPGHTEHGEYHAIYQRFAEIIELGISDVDLRPLKLVADAFLLAQRHSTEAFYE